jgi:hypothetical protein
MEEVTHTEKETVGASAINLTNELFCKPKQLADVKLLHEFIVLPFALPQAPLKSHIEVALAQFELDGMLMLQDGKAGGRGAALVLNVIDHETRLPALVGALLSSMHNFHVPLGFCPLFTAPKCPSGRKVPVNGAELNFMGAEAVELKHVFV